MDATTKNLTQGAAYLKRSQLRTMGMVAGDDMADQPGELGGILKRIHRRLARLGKSPRWASLAAGNPDYIRNMDKQYRQGRQHSADEEKLRRLAGPLGTTFEWLWKGTGQEEVSRSREKRRSLDKKEITRQRRAVNLLARGASPSTGHARIAGTVQPGWFEVDQTSESAISVPLDPNYSAEHQCAYFVQGNSVNNIAQEGDYLIAIDCNVPDIDPSPGQLVIVVRTRAGLFETTARRFNKVEDRTEFSYESSDPRYRDQEPLHLTTDDDSEIEIRGIVVSVYRQV